MLVVGGVEVGLLREELNVLNGGGGNNATY